MKANHNSPDVTIATDNVVFNIVKELFESKSQIFFKKEKKKVAKKKRKNFKKEIPICMSSFLRFKTYQ